MDIDPTSAAEQLRTADNIGTKVTSELGYANTFFTLCGWLMIVFGLLSSRSRPLSMVAAYRLQNQLWYLYGLGLLVPAIICGVLYLVQGKRGRSAQ